MDKHHAELPLGEGPSGKGPSGEEPSGEEPLREGPRRGEARATRVKRLKMRAMRRGIREMDLILSAFADARLDGMSDGELDLFDHLLGENDQELYAWVTGQSPAEAVFAGLVDDIARNYQGNGQG